VDFARRLNVAALGSPGRLSSKPAILSPLSGNQGCPRSPLTARPRQVCFPIPPKYLNLCRVPLMPDLIVQFVCTNAEARAEEFQRHLIDQKSRVRPETQGSEIWLTFSNIKDDVIKKIIREAHPWCLDRGLSLMQGSGEAGPSQATMLLVADLARVVG